MSHTYLQDLLLRMDSRERLPNAGPHPSSSDTVAWVAYREAEHLDDLGLLPELETRIQEAKRVRDFQKLAIVTGHLARNTNGNAHKAFQLLLERTPKSDDAWHYVLEHARKAGIPAARPYALHVISEPFKRNLAFTAAIEYLGVMGTDEDVELLGRLLDRHCDKRCHPMYSVFALQNLGHRSAIPYLRRAIENRAGSRKSEDLETVYYARFAIEHIQEMPPPHIGDASVESWTLMAKGDQRLAIVQYQGVYALLTCDVNWLPESSESVVDHKAAMVLAKARHESKGLAWHQTHIAT